MEENKEIKDMKEEKQTQNTEKKKIEKKTDVAEKTEKKKANETKENKKKTKVARTKKTETKEKKEATKKKHTALKVILTIIIISLLLFLVHFARNYIIIQDISQKQADINKIKNFSYTTEFYSTNNPEEKTVTERYYKEGKSIMVVSPKNQDTVIFWHDEETKETIILNPKNLTATIQQGESSFLARSMQIVTPFTEEELKIACTFLISSEQLEEKDCYKINYGGAKTWIVKKDGRVARCLNGKVTIDGKDYDTITDYKDWKENQLTDVDMARPNLIGYTVTYVQ